MDRAAIIKSIDDEIKRLEAAKALLMGEGTVEAGKKRGDLSPAGKEVIRRAAFLRHAKERKQPKEIIAKLEKDLAMAKTEKQAADGLKHSAK